MPIEILGIVCITFLGVVMTRLSIFLMLTVIISSSAFAQNSPNLASFKEKMDKYTEDGMKAYQAKDYGSACGYLGMALDYADELGMKKEANKELIKNRSAACAQSQKNQINEIVSTYNNMVENNPYKNDCRRLIAAKNACSNAGNFDNCMKLIIIGILIIII
jgi:hypothetical protein